MGVRSALALGLVAHARRCMPERCADTSPLRPSFTPAARFVCRKTIEHKRASERSRVPRWRKLTESACVVGFRVFVRRFLGLVTVIIQAANVLLVLSHDMAESYFVPTIIIECLQACQGCCGRRGEWYACHWQVSA